MQPAGSGRVVAAGHNAGVEPREVWVSPPPRSAKPPWVVDSDLLDAPVPAWVRGRLREWRMVNPDTREWTGLVHWTVNGLSYEQWLPSDRIRALDNPPS